MTDVRSLISMLSFLRSIRVMSTSLRSHTDVAPLVAIVRRTRPKSSIVSPVWRSIGSRLGVKKFSKTSSFTCASAAS